VIAVVPFLPHCPQRAQTRGDRARQLGSLGTGHRVLLCTLKRRASSAATTASTSIAAGIVMSSGGPSPSCPNPNNDGEDKGKGKGKGNNSSDIYDNNSRAATPQHGPPSTVPSVALLRALADTSTAPAVGRNLYLVALDEHVGSIVIGQLLQHHGLDSPSGHRLSHRLRCLQPHHIGCR
jgi:hypothetical protein